MRRGDIYMAAARGAYSGKPRPVVVVQDDRFDATASVTVVPFTTSDVDAPLFGIVVQPSETTGLAETSRLMISPNWPGGPVRPIPNCWATNSLCSMRARPLCPPRSTTPPPGPMLGPPHTLIDRAVSRDDGD
ncbi:type II toxin-antitoxin system PemK/MazF family toxin [Mycobacterium avium subsp. hominissuis]|uniref:Type II toxin-antitoxin system PemK/MazF family toxin n=1 Tax=Mycobacterium avium subsp. hominissuis TaxID=439334 RepID=A0A3B6XB06_MYCAV|nr:type II toxin-antitoxin system PemK/MazF family toxin [Mycobacterium avium subsp. hominissuis]QCR73437.1 type II toxin-antitoxin system PemK/MazF family toxin [Mycobacterium avium subsp. hominissuis]QCR76735.1 type II toxin-antitoxin system PemK/MazF family toxin [Mycobacterium avium subsp. hominissuis]QCR80068.1 type II toxin-antitoxin system PemK/MazF family toxin [Mycobacterium avium subsp. hominissuis]